MKVWTKDDVAAKISSSPTFMQQVIVMVYENGQEADEKQRKDTIHRNRRGFTKAQATRGTWYAEAIKAGKALKGEDLGKGRKIAMVYCQQVVELLNETRRYAFLASRKQTA